MWFYVILTESEWLDSSNCWPERDYLGEMFSYLRRSRCSQASERKLRLFGCACCRRIWHLLDSSSRNAVAVAEQFADGLVSKEELSAVWGAAGRRRRRGRPARRR